MSDGDPFRAIRRARNAPPKPAPGERCEMCRVEIPEEHEHVVNVSTRSLMCSCRACWLLFCAPGAAGGRYRGVPDRYLSVADLELTAAQWDRLQIPVAVAFFFQNSELGHVAAFYPSPAGATESMLPLAAWEEIAAANPILSTLEPDVEALLVRMLDSGPESYIVPIDSCYELVGVIRMRWKGFDGGEDAHAAIDTHFASVRERAGSVHADASS